MRTDVPEKLLKISSDIKDKGPQNLTRLTVLKRWFVRPERLASFAVFIAKRAASRKGKTKNEAAILFKKACDLLKDVNVYTPEISMEKAKQLFYELSSFQNEINKYKWNDIRTIKNRNLYLIEEGLRIYIWDREHPSSGYRLAVSYCENYDSAHGNMLDDKSKYKIEEIVRFMIDYEVLNDC